VLEKPITIFLNSTALLAVLDNTRAASIVGAPGPAKPGYNGDEIAQQETTIIGDNYGRVFVTGATNRTRRV
jgi:hypothetical protein